MFNKNITDRSEEILAAFEKEEKEFRNHWVWKNLNCSPEEFFKALKRHVHTLKIPPAEWEKELKKAKEASRIRSLERRQVYRPANFQLIGNLKV